MGGFVNGRVTRIAAIVGTVVVLVLNYCSISCRRHFQPLAQIAGSFG